MTFVPGVPECCAECGTQKSGGVAYSICDQCGRKSPDGQVGLPLNATAFLNPDAPDGTSRTEHYDFCGWVCAFTKLVDLSLRADVRFVSLPVLAVDHGNPPASARDFRWCLPGHFDADPETLRTSPSPREQLEEEVAHLLQTATPAQAAVLERYRQFVDRLLRHMHQRYVEGHHWDRPYARFLNDIDEEVFP